MTPAILLDRDKFRSSRTFVRRGRNDCCFGIPIELLDCLLRIMLSHAGPYLLMSDTKLLSEKLERLNPSLPLDTRRCREVAHDLNNWLCCIEMLAGENAEKGLSPDQFAVRLSHIREAVHQAAELCRELATPTEVGSCEDLPATVQRARLDPRHLLMEIQPLIAALIPPQATMRLEIDRELPSVSGDPAQLKSVVINLVKNAVEALDLDSGEVTVRAQVVELGTDDFSPPPYQRKRGRYVTIEVSDDGCGLAQEAINKIFDPSFSSKGSGHGLGMASVQGIVARHRGWIQVRSRPGGGTAIRAYLPCNGSADTSNQAPAAALNRRLNASCGNAATNTHDKLQHKAKMPGPSSIRHHGNVLVVDDQRTFRMLAECLLEPNGFSVSSTPSAEDALQTLKRDDHGFTAVLLDLRLEGMGGVECCQQIRRVAPDLPVILTTGCSRSEIESAFVGNQPPDAILEKPFNLELLLKTLHVVHQ